MNKESRIGLRITEDVSNKIDRLVRDGKFSSRSDFGHRAITMLLDSIEEEEDDKKLMMKVIYHLFLKVDHPKHILPTSLKNKFKDRIRELESSVW